MNDPYLLAEYRRNNRYQQRQAEYIQRNEVEVRDFWININNKYRPARREQEASYEQHKTHL